MQEKMLQKKLQQLGNLIHRLSNDITLPILLNKTRPCVVYSDYFRNHGNDIVIVPIKSYKGKYNQHIHVFLDKNVFKGLRKHSIVDIMGIRSVSKKRIGKLIDRLDNDTLQYIDKKFSKAFALRKNIKK